MPIRPNRAPGGRLEVIGDEGAHQFDQRFVRLKAERTRAQLLEIGAGTTEIRKLIIKRATAQDLAKIAIAQGMKTLRTVSLEKVRDGYSTLEQTLLVTSGE